MNNNDFNNNTYLGTENLLLLKKQFNPHFINNTFNSIQNFILIGDLENSLKYVALIAKYFRIVNDHSLKKEVSIVEEIEFLNTYIQLQDLRFNDKLKINLAIDPFMDKFTEEKKIPPFIIKAIVENAIEHGVFHNQSGGEVSIIFKKENELINITIEDNGIGINKSKKINSWKVIEAHQSSLVLIEKILQIKPIIKDIQKQNGELEGTRVVLKI